MGITGELVRSVFSKNRSLATHESNVRSSAVEKKRWSSVRTYLCGDELHSSVIAEEDSASWGSELTVSRTMPKSSSEEITITQPTIETSEASVTQPVLEEGDIQSKDAKENLQEGRENSTANLFLREDAAIVIQSAFRSFLARRRIAAIKQQSNQEIVVAAGSPSRESVGTSTEVQTGKSTGVFSTREEIMAVHHRLQQKARTAAVKLKEEWDDSTLSSNKIRMRIQNRLEATTRRERALAYAFSQQLGMCSKKKQNRSDGNETNVGWSWLERWMATRLPESSSLESHVGNQVEPINMNQRSVVVRERIFMDVVGGEEKESCGSNEVSIHFDSISESAPKETYATKPTRHRLKAAKSISRRKTVPSYNFPREQYFDGKASSINNSCWNI